MLLRLSQSAERIKTKVNFTNSLWQYSKTRLHDLLSRFDINQGITEQTTRQTDKHAQGEGEKKGDKSVWGVVWACDEIAADYLCVCDDRLIRALRVLGPSSRSRC